MNRSLLAGSCALALLGVGSAYAAGFFTPGLPLATGSPSTGFATTLPLTGIEQIPADTLLSGGANPQSEAITTAQLANYAGSITWGENYLIGGDFSTGQNLWQRGTSGTAQSSATTAYDGPDRWFEWSGTSSEITVSKSTTAASLPTTVSAAAKMLHTNSTGGYGCMGQVLTTANSLPLAGKTVEFTFNVATGAGYDGTGIHAYIVYGTGTDESSNLMAFTVNGGGATGFTGGATAANASILLGASAAVTKYGVIATLPSTETQVGVAICNTFSTATTNNFVALSGMQLVPNNGLASLASSSASYTTSNAQLTVLRRRLSTQEAQLQQAYYWQINEPAASLTVSNGGTYYTTTTCLVPFTFPVQMRIAPTASFGGTALSSSTWAIIANSATPIALATTYLVQSALGANTTYQGALTATTGAKTAGFGCALVGAGGGGTINWSSEL